VSGSFGISKTLIMDYSNFQFALSALYALLIFISIIKNGMAKAILCSTNRFKFLLLGLLTSILCLMFLCDYSGHRNSTYCVFFIGFVPVLIFYYCVHLVTKSVNGLKKLFQGKKFDDILMLFLMFSYLPTFIAIVKMIMAGNTMFLLIDVLGSFFEDDSNKNK
jgi:hypothetical protein